MGRKPETPLHQRIRTAWQEALDFGEIGPSFEDFAAALDHEANDGKQFLVAAPVAKWLDGSVTPSFRTMKGIAKIARYNRARSLELFYGRRASKFRLTERDWLRYVESLQ